MPDDLRERIAAAIEAGGFRLLADAHAEAEAPAATRTRPQQFVIDALGVAFREAARIARETPDAAAGREARIGELEARVGELEAAAHEAEARDVHERELDDHGR